MPKNTSPFELRVLPTGRVGPLVSCGHGPGAGGLTARFSDHEAAGLVALAAASVPQPVSASVLFWRDLAADFLRALCHVPENEPFSPESIAPPEPARLAEWVLNAPPMPGAEYLSPDMLLALWQRLVDWTVEQAAVCGGPGAFLETYAPQWSRVGRVTVHLAENKGDEEFPFAFMATYAAGLTRGGRVRRLPLGKALEEYAGAQKKPELLKLLSPLHAAAQRGELMADLVETGDIFHPLVWTPTEAHQFLKEIPLYDECGLLALLPNWWRKRARPQVSVSLDSKKGGTLGMDALLEFRMGLALGDEELTDKEIKALLQNQDGLVRLRGERRFASADELVEQMKRDVEATRRVCASFQRP